MNDPIVFASAVALNLIGAILQCTVICIVLWQSRGARINKLLALYIGVCLAWSVTALMGRFVMTSTMIGDAAQNEAFVRTLTFTIVVLLTTNSPYLLMFVVDYVGFWHKRRWKAAIILAFAAKVTLLLLLHFFPNSVIESYGITEAGMVSVEPKPIAIPLIAGTYFLTYAVSIYLMWRYKWPKSKWPIIGTVSIAAGPSLLK